MYIQVATEVLLKKHDAGLYAAWSVRRAAVLAQKG